MTAPRPAAAPMAPAPKPKLGPQGAVPRAPADPLRVTTSATPNFGDVLVEASARAVAPDAGGAPALRQEPGSPRNGASATETTAALLLDGLEVEPDPERPASRDRVEARGGVRRDARPPVAEPVLVPADVPLDLVRSAPHAPAPAPFAEPAPDVRLQEVQTIAAILGSAAGPVPLGTRAAAAERPVAPVSAALRTTPAAAENRGSVASVGEIPPLDVRISRLAATVSRIETHFAPVQHPSITTVERRAEHARTDSAGIFEQIRNVLDGGSERAAGETRPATTAPLPTPATATAVRVLEIALHPAALGSLTVTLRLTGTGTLKVAVSASERDTAAALEEDAEALAAVVAAAGYAVDEVTIAHDRRL